MSFDNKTGAVILNYKDNENTIRLCHDFENYSCIEKIVVVDNSGEVGLSETDFKGAEFSKTLLLNVQNNGYSAGNNRGIEKLDELGSFKYIIISNPDIFIEEKAVAACIDFLEKNEDYAIAAPRMHTKDGKPHHLAAWNERTFLCDLAYSSGILSRTVGMYRECYDESFFKKEIATVDCVAGSFFVISRKALKKVGNFDTNTFLYYEEDILGYKLKRLGLKTALLCREKFLHCEGNSVNKSFNYLKRYRTMQKSRLYFHRTYLKTPKHRYFILLLATLLGTLEKSVKTIMAKLKK